MEPYEQKRIPSWVSPITDPLTGRWITSHIMNQDFVAWVGQGAVADRTQEHLGESDRGIIMMRRALLEDAATVRAGGQPRALVRDAEAARCIALPTVDRERYVNGFSRPQLSRE